MIAWPDIISLGHNKIGDATFPWILEWKTEETKMRKFFWILILEFQVFTQIARNSYIDLNVVNLFAVENQCPFEFATQE